MIETAMPLTVLLPKYGLNNYWGLHINHAKVTTALHALCTLIHTKILHFTYFLFYLYIYIHK